MFREEVKEIREHFLKADVDERKRIISSAQREKRMYLLLAGTNDEMMEFISSLGVETSISAGVISPDGFTPLMIAIMCAFYDAIHPLLSCMSIQDLLHRDSYGCTALHYAVRGASTDTTADVAEAIKKFGVRYWNENLLIRNDLANTPLVEAVLNHGAMAIDLIYQGADFTHLDEDFSYNPKPPCVRNKTGVIAFLLNRMVDQHKDRCDTTYRFQKDRELVLLLITGGVPLDSVRRNKGGGLRSTSLEDETPSLWSLFTAIEFEDVELVCEMIKRNAQMTKGFRELTSAILSRNCRCISYLLSYIANSVPDVNVYDLTRKVVYEQSFFHDLTSLGGDVDVLELLFAFCGNTFPESEGEDADYHGRNRMISFSLASFTSFYSDGLFVQRLLHFLMVSFPGWVNTPLNHFSSKGDKTVFDHIKSFCTSTQTLEYIYENRLPTLFDLLSHHLAMDELRESVLDLYPSLFEK